MDNNYSVSIEIKRVLNKNGTIDIIESYHQSYLKENNLNFKFFELISLLTIKKIIKCYNSKC